MSLFQCFFKPTWVTYVLDLFPKIVSKALRKLRRELANRHMAAVAGGPPEDCGPGGTQTGDGEPVEAAEFSCPGFCSELSRRQNLQRKDGLFCDATLVFTFAGRETQTLAAHRSVLSAASEYFSLRLGGRMSESQAGRVELADWSPDPVPEPDTVERVLQFMYTGDIRVTAANVCGVLQLADRFQLSKLKIFCGEYLLKKLSLASCVTMHRLAHQYQLDQLAQGAAEMVRRNFNKVINHDEFYTLPFHLVQSWLSDSKITVDSEQELFEAIVKWVHQNEEEHEKHFEELFKLLKLQQIAPSYLIRVVRQEALVASSAACLQLVSEALEIHAIFLERPKSADLELSASYKAAIQPRYGQNMDVILVVGGVSEGGDYLSECVGYFVAEDRWINLPHIHNHLDGHAIAISDSHVYVAGSMEPSFARAVERYDPNLNAWQQLSVMSSRKHSFGLICVGDKLYTIGGHGNFSPGFKDVMVYEPEQDKWLSLDPAPKILRDVKMVSVDNRFLYMMAQTPVEWEYEDILSTVIVCYDTETHTWKEVDSLPLLDNYCIFQMAMASTNFYHTASCCPKSYKVKAVEAQQKLGSKVSEDILDSLPPEVSSMEGAAICHMEDDIFIIGGWKNTKSMEKRYRKEAYRYCSESKRWMLLPPMPQPRCRAAACHVRIPYQYLRGCQHYPVPPSLVQQQENMQVMQQLHRQTRSLRRQMQSQVHC